MAGFKPEEVKKALKLPDNEQPVYIMPIGKKIKHLLFRKKSYSCGYECGNIRIETCNFGRVIFWMREGCL